jgi:hypothetical protein
MAKKTRRARKVTRTRRRSSDKQKTQQAPPNETEIHHYSAKMAFDGKTLVSETQKDNEPAQRRVYTLKQLAREIPLAAELGKEHLGWNDSHVIQYPATPRNLAFHSVLPNPVDLGLMPPNHHRHHKHRTMRRMRAPPHREPGDADAGAGADDGIQLTVQDNHAQRRNLFDLPVV